MEGLKKALSRNIEFVEADTADSLPPMIPANATALSSSDITKQESSSTQ